MKVEKGYKFKFYINAKHSVDFGEGQSSIHPHTWEIVLYIRVKNDKMINFTKFESVLEEYFDQYEGKYLNEMERFKGEDPTMERIGLTLYEDIYLSVSKTSIYLEQLEISENPTRTYIIKS